MTLSRVYKGGRLVDQGFPVAEVSDRLADPDAVAWFDLCAPSREELASIGEELGLHDLAVEGALAEAQRPKLVRFAEHQFLTAYAVRFDAETGELTTADIAAFITHNALVTVRKSDAFDIEELERRWDAGGELARHGVPFLLHGLLDYIVDTHLDTAQALDQSLDDLEDDVFADRAPQQGTQRRMFTLRKSLLALRRVTMPMRELANSVVRRDLADYDEAMQPYFLDVYDHALRVIDWTDSMRELITTAMETQLTLRGNRLNVIMKQVTSWAAIIAVPTAVTGFYGMNVPYPGFGKVAGVWSSIAIIVLMSAALYVIFKRKGWL
jgi:magnesium transporter